MERPIVRRTESQLDGADGCTLFRRAWLPPHPERIVVLVHGYAEHSGRYDFTGAFLAARGIGVHAYDQRGHGRSGGPRCHVDRFEELLDDLALFLERVRKEHPGAALLLLGHSMGGLVVASFLAERKPALAGAVLSGPALRMPAVPRTRLLAIQALARIFPRLTLESRIDPEGLSRDPAVVRAYVEDPLVGRTMTVSLAAALFAAARRIRARAGEVAVPVLLLHGEADPLCAADGSRDFHAGLREPASRLRVYPGLRHEILNEPEREQVLEDVLSWLAKPDVPTERAA